MDRITSKQVSDLLEAYSAVYVEKEIDEEVLSQEIFEQISHSLISKGYTAVNVIEYFADSTAEDIVEDYVSLFDGEILVESVVSEEYIEEQIEQLNEIISAIPAALRVASMAPRVAGLAARVGNAALKSRQFGQAAGAGAKALQRAVQQGGGTLRGAIKASTPVGSRAVSAVKGAVSSLGSKLGGAAQKVKGAATGALNKLPGGSGGKLAGALKTGGKLALGGAAFEAGTRGAESLLNRAQGPAAKAAPSGDKAKWNASKALGGQTAFAAGGGKAALQSGKFKTAADVQKAGSQALFKAGGGTSAMSQKGQTRAQVVAQGAKNVAPRPAAKASPAPAAAPEVKATNTLAAKPSQPAVKPAAKAAPSGETDMQKWAKANPTLAAKVKPGQSGYQEISRIREKPSSYEKQDQTPTQGPSSAKIDTASVQADLKAAQEREKKKAQVVTTTKESYDAFDIVLEYLLENGHASTVTEAAYIMTEMDSETISDIVEKKSYSAKAARAGEDIGKPGKQFEKIAKEAGERYGSKERGEKVAGAVLAKLRAK